MVLGIGYQFMLSFPYAFMVMLLIERFRGFKDATELMLVYLVVQITCFFFARFIIWGIAHKARSGYSRNKL